MASEPGSCPRCELPLMLTCELRTLSQADLDAEVERQRRLEQQRRELPLV
ncbi:MAG: hypothetical protein H0U84_06780 [Thermoleophilaceae bacterium]|nr:hypothetical protein [Thermoleophilaceae bacterium]